MSATTSTAQATSQNAKWTVMVFMGAAGFGASVPLVEPAKDDLEEMRSVGSGNGLNIFVQIHGIEPPRRGLVTERTTGIETLDEVPNNEREAAQGQALLNFVKSSLYAAGYTGREPYPHYLMLVMWGHAYDFAIGREKRRDGTIDAIDFASFSDVLKNLQKEFGTPGRKLDILAFDACEVATVEMACQLEPFANYLLASEIGIPIPGWPYDAVLRRLKDPNPKTGPMLPMELGSWVVRRFCEAYNAATDVVSLTLLDLNRAHELSAFGKYLSLALAKAIGDAEAEDLIAYLFSQSQTASDKPYVDVADLCYSLMREVDDQDVLEAATSFGDFLVSPLPTLDGEGRTERSRPFVVEHGRNAGRTARLNGISIYAPHVAPDRDFEAVQPLYEEFVFAKESEWSALVHALARLG